MLQRVILAVLCFGIVAPLSAQFQESVDVTVINIDVEVRDRDGNPVHGLDADDFEVREGRRKRDISNFTEYASGSGARRSGPDAPAGAAPARSRPPLHLVIFVDQRNWPLLDHRRVGETLHEMIEKNVQPGDRVRIVGWQRRLFDIVGWTDDRETLAAGIDRAFDMSNVSGLTHEDEVDQSSLALERAVSADAGITEGAIGSAGPYTVTEAVADSQRWVSTKLRWSSLTTVAESMGALDGRRMMLLITTKMGRAMGARALRADDPSVPLRQRFVRAATAAGVSVSALYPEPSWNGMSAEMGEVESANPEISLRDFGTLQEVADQTGGTLAWGVGMIEEHIPRLAEGLSNFYSIGYRSNLEEGDRRNITVTIPGRKDLRVFARRSVARLSDQERLESMVVAHAIKPEISQMPINLEMNPEPGRRGRNAVKIVVRFMVDDLAFEVGDDAATGGFLVAAVAVDSRTGETGQVVVDRHEVRISRDQYDSLSPGQHLTWDAVVRYSESSDTIAIGVMDMVSELTGLIRAPLPARD